MNRRRRFALASAFATALAACNAITGLSDDYHLEGSNPDAEGGSDSPSGNDGSPPVDSPTGDSSDAGQDVTGPTDFCADAQPNTYCNDFEDASLTGPMWGFNSYDPQTGGAVDVVPGLGRNGSRGLKATVSPSKAQSRGFTLIQAFTGLTFAHGDLSFDFYVKTNGLEYLVIGHIGFNVAASGPAYGLAEHNMNLLDVSDPPKPTDLIGLADAHGKWYHASIQLDARDGAPGYDAKIVVDNTTVDTTSPFAQNIAGKVPEIGVGVFFTSTDGGAAEVDIDNVLFRTR